MNTETPYIITYSNHFYFNNCCLAFKKKKLFDITKLPKYIPFSVDHWNIKGKQLSVQMSHDLIKQDPINIDVSQLQWYEQERLNHIINII